MALFIAMHVGGFVLLVASLLAVFFNGRREVPDRPAMWKRLWGRRWQVGILLGLLSPFSFYPVRFDGKWCTIYGVPFVVCEIVEGDGDPHGPGMISMVLNFAFWLFLPQSVLWVTSGRRRKPEAGPRPTSQSPRSIGSEVE